MDEFRSASNLLERALDKAIEADKAERSACVAHLAFVNNTDEMQREILRDAAHKAFRYNNAKQQDAREAKADALRVMRAAIERTR